MNPNNKKKPGFEILADVDPEGEEEILWEEIDTGDLDRPHDDELPDVYQGI